MPHLCMMLKTSSFDEIKKTLLVIIIEINQINSTLNFELCTISQTHEAPQPFNVDKVFEDLLVYS